MSSWQEFVIAHCGQSRKEHVAAVVGQPVDKIEQLRSRGVCVNKRKKQAKDFQELFALYHGRPADDSEWPKPVRSNQGKYEWQSREYALLATLVGSMPPAEIAGVLTERLRAITGDPKAIRSKNSVLISIGRIGLQAGDVLGGITASEAGRQINSYGSVLNAIDKGELETRRQGKLVIIPHEAWRSWKESRPQPPVGFVRLTPIFKQLGISSDSKPAEFAIYIPTAKLYYPFGMRGGGSVRGVWFIDAAVGRKLVEDRRRGLPMPWHGMPNAGNLKAAWTKLQQRKHPDTCMDCRRVFPKGLPATFDDFCRDYPPLSLGDKRHLTRQWNPGLTPKELATEMGFHLGYIHQAIRNGTLRAKRQGQLYFITRTDAARWKARNRPTGDGKYSWLTVPLAERWYGFTEAETRAFVRAGKLIHKEGAIGQLLVSRQQCRELRDSIGYTESEAARRAGVSVTKFRALLRGLDLGRRARDGYPPELIRNVLRRIYNPPGLTFAQAAEKIEMPEHWIRYQLKLGRIEVVRVKWDHKQYFLTRAAIAKLEQLKAEESRSPMVLGSDWMLLSEAARHAGVSTKTVRTWDRVERVLNHRKTVTGLRYHRPTVETRARAYWEKGRLKRAVPPAWLQDEVRKAA